MLSIILFTRIYAIVVLILDVNFESILSKEECNKQLLEQKEGDSGLCLKEDINGCAISKE